MKKITLLFMLLFVALIGVNNEVVAQTTSASLGAGTSSSATRGPFQRSSNTSSSVYSNANLVYTAAELASIGITTGMTISQINWDLGSTNVITATGNATVNIYMKNSAVTDATPDLWVNLLTGSTLFGTYTFNTTNNFPGTTGFLGFPLSSNFVYTGGTIEVLVEWDCSGLVSTNADPNQLLDGNGSLNWYWDATTHNSSIYRSGSSSAPTDINTTPKAERVNTQFVYGAPTVTCPLPTALNVSNITLNGADLSWAAATGAASYDWKVVATGAGSGGTAIAGGTTANTSVTAASLAPLTTYDFYVEANCGANGTSGFAGPVTFTTSGTSQTTVTIGAGTSSSSTRGPLQRADINSSTVFSRFNQVYTAAELATAGMTSGAVITELQWDLASTNVIIGTGNANIKIYIKNSTSIVAVPDTFTNLIAGSTLVYDTDFNTTNNFPGANGWMPFNLATPFLYTGGALEIAVDWDCSQVSTPAFDGDGSLKWRWDATTPVDLVAYQTASSAPPSILTNTRDERANIQMVYSVVSCDDPTNLNATNITTTNADLSWTGAATATSYTWVVVAAGAGSTGTSIDGGTTTMSMVTTTALTAGTAYDLFVMSDCGTIGMSAFAGPYSFTTACPGTIAAVVTNTVTNVSCNGGSDGAVDLTVTGGVPPFTYAWGMGATTQDLTGLAAGTYVVTITNASNCSTTSNITVTQPAVLVVTTTSVSDNAGAGVGSATAVAVGGTAPYTFAWDGTVGTATLSNLTTGTYSVSVTDVNGCTDTSSVFVDNSSNTSNIDYLTNLSITPNPTNGNVMIDLELSQNADISISIYTITGVLVQEFSPENTTQKRALLDLSNNANGLYLVRFVIDNQVFTKKLVLNK